MDTIEAIVSSQVDHTGEPNGLEEDDVKRSVVDGLF